MWDFYPERCYLMSCNICQDDTATGTKEQVSGSGASDAGIWAHEPRGET